MGEAQFGRFSQSLLPARCRPHLTGQTHLTKGNQALGEGFAAQTAVDGQEHRQVRGGLTDAHPAHGVHKHVLVHARHPCMAMQHGQQHGQAVALQAHRQPPGVGAARVHQGLDFHQERARALQGHQHTTAGHGLGVLAQENGAGVAHPFEAFFRHGEDANFIDRAKAVFDGPHQPKARVRVAFKIQHRVDHVLKHPWARQGPLFGHVAHQNDGDAARFGKPCEVSGTLAHLGDRARCTR